VSFESESADLYVLAPNDFTAARNTSVSEARKDGDTALATSLKKLRKPTVGAWLANLLARERAEELERLITLGGELRKGHNRADGELIRAVSRQKQDAIATLLSDANSMARSRGQSVSEAASTDLESTLDAAFADPKAAETVRAGRLTTALHYSGLGLADTGSASPTRVSSKVDRSNSAILGARRDLELARNEAARADAEFEKARRAVAMAESDLKRLKAAAAVADRRASDARKRVSSAEKKLSR
jgi:hypothetical protein